MVSKIMLNRNQVKQLIDDLTNYFDNGVVPSSVRYCCHTFNTCLCFEERSVNGVKYLMFGWDEFEVEDNEPED